MSHAKRGAVLLSKVLGNVKTFNNRQNINASFHVFSRNIRQSTQLPAKVAFNLSDIGEGIREVVVKEWYVKEGDKVSQFDNICEVQSDKASVTITSRYEGTISKLYYKIDDIALVGKPLIDVETEQSEPDTTKLVKKIPSTIKNDPIVIQPKSDPEPNQNVTLCIPSVRRLAKEHQIDLSNVTGSGKNGRILKENVLEYLNKPQEKATTQAGNRTEPIKGFQKAMVKTMTESLKIPHFVYSDEIKLTKLVNLRESLKNLPQLADIKISFMPFFIKATSNALTRFPVINSTIDEKCENITYLSQHNIGVAMDTKIGLAVPVIKNVQDLNILEIAKELNRLMLNGKSGTFAVSDLTEGTFTISNIGVIGGTYTKPVILPPQVAIFALGATQVLPRFDAQNNVVPEHIVNISASADHRVISGAVMAHFISIIKRQLENPNLLLLNL